VAGRGISPPVELTVEEAPQPDVGFGRARISERTRRLLDIELGGFLEIVGQRSTVASAYELPREDEGLDVIRVDPLVRRNANTRLGDKVSVARTDVEPAEEVVLAPIIDRGHSISFGDGIGDFVKRGLQQRPLTRGDVVVVSGLALMGGPLPFAVVRTTPGTSVQVIDATKVALRERPFREIEAESPED